MKVAEVLHENIIGDSMMYLFKVLFDWSGEYGIGEHAIAWVIWFAVCKGIRSSLILALLNINQKRWPKEKKKKWIDDIIQQIRGHLQTGDFEFDENIYNKLQDEMAEAIKSNDIRKAYQTAQTYKKLAKTAVPADNE